MKVDLSGTADLQHDHRDALNEIAASLRKPFNEFVLGVGAPNGDNIDWWVTPLACRNVFACPLFARVCRLVLAIRLAEENSSIREIVVETPGMAYALTLALASRGSPIQVTSTRGSVRFWSQVVAEMLYRLAGAIFHTVNQMLFSRLERGSRKLDGARIAVLLDTFVYRDSFGPGFRDRHYPGLLDCLTSEERDRVFFLPSYYRIRNYRRIFQSLRSSTVNFLVKEDYLRKSDYLFALAHPLRLSRLPLGSCRFGSHEIASMVKEALCESAGASGSIEGLLRYRLAQRLGEAAIRVKILVDWFENQEIDHGSNAGFRRYLPDTAIVGYQGFVVPELYLSTFPTSDEQRLALIPHRVAVTGAALLDRAKAFCPHLEVETAPAFRFAGVWRHRHDARPSPTFRVLVALPLMRAESDAVLDVMRQVAIEAGTGADHPWHIQVKAHPSFTAALPRQFEKTESDLDELLGECDVLVSTASSVCLQALAHGVPVVVLGNRRSITFNPIPRDCEPQMWTLCYSVSETHSALARYAARDASDVAADRANGVRVRDRFFSPVTREAVLAFIGFESAAHADAVRHC